MSRESTIQFETNRYSVPPQYIGETLTVKIDPFCRQAELQYRGNPIRSFFLAPSGSRLRIYVPEDRRALAERWEKELARQQERKLMSRKKHRHTANPEVEVRSPVFYDSLIGAGAQG